MPDCPHCNVAIETLPGFVPQATLESRLGAKDGEITALKASLGTATAQAQGHTALVSENTTLKTQLAERDQRDERNTALTTAGVAADMLPHLELVFNSQQAGVEEPATFGDWLATDETKAHPLLAGLFGAPPDPNAPPVPPVVPPRTLPLPNGDTVVPAPPPGGEIKESDTADLFGSARYQNASADDQKTMFTEHMGKVQAQAGA